MTSVRRGSVCRLCVSLAIALSPVMFAGCGGGSSKATSSQPGSVQTASLEQQFVGVVKQVQPQVAQIQTGSGLGSGVVFDTRGHIVTNAHVIAGGGSLVVTLADRSSLPGHGRWLVPTR